MTQSSAKAWLVRVAVVLCLASASYADTITGKTVMGCFSSPANGNTATCGSTTAYDAGLTFTASGFTGQTDNTGYMAIGGSNGFFGSLTLGTDAATYAGDSFLLSVVISEPGNGTNSVTAKLKGSVTTDPTGGGVTILFNNPTSITLDNGQLLALDVNNISVFPGTAPVWITGDAQLSGTPVRAPEPAAALLLGTGLLSLGGVRRRLLSRRNLEALNP